MAAPALDKTQPTAAYVPPEERKKTIWTSFLSFIWDNDTHLKSPEERKLLFKLDCVMLPCLCLGELAIPPLAAPWPSAKIDRGRR
jgi:ACS family pantothenate transporter-like MFS transporter